MRSGNTLWFLVILTLLVLCVISRADCGCTNPADCRCGDKCDCAACDNALVLADDGKMYPVKAWKGTPYYETAKRRAHRSLGGYGTGSYSPRWEAPVGFFSSCRT